MIKAWIEKNERRAAHTQMLSAAAERAHAAAATKVARMRADAARLTEDATKLAEGAESAYAASKTHAAQFGAEEPSERLVECGAYLYEAAMRGNAPSFHDAARRGYRVHAAALHSALQDALALGEVVQSSDGRLALNGPEGVVCAMWDRRECRTPQNSK